MNKPFYFKNIGTIDPSPIINFLNSDAISFGPSPNVQWTGDFNKMHNREVYFKNVKALCAIDEFKVFDIFEELKFNLSEVAQFLLDSYGEGRIYKCHFSKLTSSSRITPHIDTGLLFSLSHRVQIPLITDDKVIFKIHDKTFKTQPGLMFEINNLRTHTVSVNSNIERVTLIIDYMENYVYDRFF